MALSTATRRELGWRFPPATVTELTNAMNSVELTNTSVATVGAATLSGASIAGGYITRSGSTAAFTDTTDTATNIIAALLGSGIGQSWGFVVTNTTAFPMTLAAGAGVTLSGLAGPIPGNATASFLATYTAVGAVTILCTSLVYNAIGGADPNNVQTQFGSASLASAFSSFSEEGNLYRNVGNPIAANGADTTDDILDGFVLPANAFDVAKRGLQLTFQGKFAATVNNKRVRIWLNPTMAGQTVTNGVISGGTVSGVGSGVLLYDSATQTGNNVGWAISAQLFKYGAAGSNTQYAQVQPIFGATHGGVVLPSFLTLPENAVINVVVTGSSMTTGAASDVVANFSEANAMN